MQWGGTTEASSALSCLVTHGSWSAGVLHWVCWKITPTSGLLTTNREPASLPEAFVFHAVQFLASSGRNYPVSSSKTFLICTLSRLSTRPHPSSRLFLLEICMEFQLFPVFKKSCLKMLVSSQCSSPFLSSSLL